MRTLRPVDPNTGGRVTGEGDCAKGMSYGAMTVQVMTPEGREPRGPQKRKSMEGRGPS
jgi:hypothetical protein